jgi:5-methylcytosine-specific restriction endonuclease McrA
MTTRPPSELRHEVSRRAGNRCEYCLLHQDFAASTHQVDHVIAEKHRGPTNSENLALSCTICNRRKGSDIGALDPETGQLVRVFSPRTQKWQEHFELKDARIVGLTPEGRATVELLHFNSYERLAERAELIQAGHFPIQSEI